MNDGYPLSIGPQMWIGLGQAILLRENKKGATKDGPQRL
jgi:hypothetical protein